MQTEASLSVVSYVKLMRFDEPKHSTFHKTPTIDNSASIRSQIEQPLPNRLAKRKWQLRIALGVFTMLIGVLLVGLVTVILLHTDGIPLPSNVTKSVNFALYYPAQLQDGYSYEKNSARIENSIVFYTLENGSSSVTIGEQVAPPNPPQLDKLPGFTTIQALAGSAVVGSTLEKPIAIISTNTSLITITGTKNTPSDVINEIAKSMTSLPQ